MYRENEREVGEEALREEVGESGLQGQDLLQRLTALKRYQEALFCDYIKSEEVVKCINAYNLESVFGRILDCGSYLVFRKYLLSGDIELTKANFCKKYKLCPFCCWRRALQLINAYSKKLERVDWPFIPVLVTLTVQHKRGECLHTVLHRLMQAWRRMLGRRRLGYSEFTKAIGGVSCIEVTWGENGWHPHMHCVFLLQDYIVQEKLSREWSQVSSGAKIVGVKLIRDWLDGAWEVFAYVGKFSKMPPERLVEFYLSTQGLHFVNPFGVLRGVKVDEDVDNGIEGPYIELFYRWLDTCYVQFAELELQGDVQRVA